MILSENEINEEELRAAVEKTGYKVLSITVSEEEKKRLFGKKTVV